MLSLIRDSLRSLYIYIYVFKLGFDKSSSSIQYKKNLIYSYVHSWHIYLFCRCLTNNSDLDSLAFDFVYLGVWRSRPAGCSTHAFDAFCRRAREAPANRPYTSTFCSSICFVFFCCLLERDRKLKKKWGENGKKMDFKSIEKIKTNSKWI